MERPLATPEPPLSDGWSSCVPGGANMRRFWLRSSAAVPPDAGLQRGRCAELDHRGRRHHPDQRLAMASPAPWPV